MIKLYQIDLGVILFGIWALSFWFTSMLYNFTKMISAVFSDKDWRFYGYAFCGQVVATIVCIVGGFMIITG